MLDLNSICILDYIYFYVAQPRRDSRDNPSISVGFCGTLRVDFYEGFRVKGMKTFSTLRKLGWFIGSQFKAPGYLNCYLVSSKIPSVNMRNTSSVYGLCRIIWKFMKLVVRNGSAESIDWSNSRHIHTGYSEKT